MSFMHSWRHRVGTGVAALSVFAVASMTHAKDETIVDLAPENAIFVASVPSLEMFTNHFRATGYWEMWQSDEMQEIVRDLMKQMTSELESAADEIGIEISDLTCPTGTAGFAFFPTMNEETGQAGPGIMLVSDLGESFEQGQQLIQTMMEKAAENGAEVETIEVAGRTVHLVTPEQMDDAGADDDDEMDDEWGDMQGMGPDPEAFVATMKTSHVAFDGTRLFITSSLDSLQGAFDAIDGTAQTSIEERSDFQALSGKLGNSDAWFMMMTRDIDSMMRALDPMGMSMMLKPMATQMFGALGGVGMGMRFDGDRAMAEQTLALYMPAGTAGLTDLLNDPRPRGELPSFVGADVVSYSHVNFQFGGIAEAIQPLLAMLPMFMGGMDPGGGPPPDIAGLLNGITSCLGDEVHVVQTMTRPLTAESLKQVMAIECTNPQQLSAMVGEFGAQMGLMPRDFMGHQIFSMDPQMAAAMAQQMGGPAVEPPALGFSSDQLFIGPSAAVESALRAAGDRAGGAAADGSVFARCSELLTSGDVVAWGFADTAQMLEAQRLIVEAQMEEMGQFMDPAEVQMAMGPAMVMMELFTPEFMQRYLGPTAWEMTSHTDGFVMKSFQLAPVEE